MWHHIVHWHECFKFNKTQWSWWIDSGSEDGLNILIYYSVHWSATTLKPLTDKLHNFDLLVIVFFYLGTLDSGFHVDATWFTLVFGWMVCSSAPRHANGWCLFNSLGLALGLTNCNDHRGVCPAYSCCFDECCVWLCVLQWERAGSW